MSAQNGVITYEQPAEPLRFLVFSIDYRGRQNDGTLGASVALVSGREGQTAAEFAQSYYKDYSVLRIYQLTELPRER